MGQIKESRIRIKKGHIRKERNSFFFDTVWKIACPITLQCLLQASFGVIDQVMTGQLGATSVAGIGLASKFASLYMVIISAIATSAGIFIAQYIGKKEEQGVQKSFSLHFFIIGGIGVLFSMIGYLLPEEIMKMYSTDYKTIGMATKYLRVISISFLPLAGATLMSTLIRCREKAKMALHASILAAIVNTGLNYLLIYGNCGLPRMGVNGAALATTIARFVEFIVLWLIAMYPKNGIRKDCQLMIKIELKQWINVCPILLPILGCEFCWGLGENVYAVVYGRLGTMACAAMTLTNPIQSLIIGGMTGVASAAGIVIGKRLGEKNYKKAYTEAKKFIYYGVIGGIGFSILLLLGCNSYIKIFDVEREVQQLTKDILIVYAMIATVKIENMIISGGIIRSGGKTAYVMGIDLFGTWCIGVPCALVTGLYFHLPIYQVYFILSMEEIARLLVSIVIFRKKKWINHFVE